MLKKIFIIIILFINSTIVHANDFLYYKKKIDSSNNKAFESFFQKEKYNYVEGIWIEKNKSGKEKKQEAFLIIASKTSPTLMYNVYYLGGNSSKQIRVIKGRLYRLKLMDKFLFILNKNNFSESKLNSVKSYSFFTMFSEIESLPKTKKIFDHNRNNKLLNLLSSSNNAKLDYILDDQLTNTQKQEARYFVKLYP